MLMNSTHKHRYDKKQITNIFTGKTDERGKLTMWSLIYWFVLFEYTAMRLFNCMLY